MSEQGVGSHRIFGWENHKLPHPVSFVESEAQSKQKIKVFRGSCVRQVASKMQYHKACFLEMLQEKFSIIKHALLSVVRKNPFLFEGLIGKCYKINKM